MQHTYLVTNMTHILSIEGYRSLASCPWINLKSLQFININTPDKFIFGIEEGDILSRAKWPGLNKFLLHSTTIDTRGWGKFIKAGWQLEVLSIGNLINTKFRVLLLTSATSC